MARYLKAVQKKLKSLWSSIGFGKKEKRRRIALRNVFPLKKKNNWKYELVKNLSALWLPQIFCWPHCLTGTFRVSSLSLRSLLCRYGHVKSIQLSLRCEKRWLPLLWFSQVGSHRFLLTCWLRVCLVPIFIEDFAHNIKEVFCCKEVCLSRDRNSRKDAQVSAVTKEPDAHPWLTTALSLHVNGFCQIDELLWARETNHLQVNQGIAHAIIYGRLGFGNVLIEMNPTARVQITFESPS